MKSEKHEVVRVFDIAVERHEILAIVLHRKASRLDDVHRITITTKRGEKFSTNITVIKLAESAFERAVDEWRNGVKTDEAVDENPA